MLDELNTRWENTTYARMQMERYLKSQPAVLAAPTMLVATDEARFTVLHDYTQTRDELLASVHAYTPRYPMQLMRNGSGNTGIEMFEETLGALTQIAESSRGTPGRKNLLWVGTGYPSIDTTTLAFDDEDKLMALIRRVTDQMMASRVCLFLIDPAGEQTTVQDSGVADGDGGFTATLSSEVGPFEGKLDFASIASTTGGKIFANRNDVDTVIGEGIRDSNAYYTLTYVPPDAGVQDGKYRQIHVVLKDPSLRAVARSGYFAESVPVDPIPASGSGEKPANTLQFDMVAAARTRLVYNGLKVRAERVGDGFHLFIGVKDLRWETSTDSNLVTELSVMTVFFNEKGKEIQSTATEIKEKVGASVEVHGGAELEIKAPAEMPKAPLGYVSWCATRPAERLDSRSRSLTGLPHSHSFHKSRLWLDMSSGQFELAVGLRMSSHPAHLEELQFSAVSPVPESDPRWQLVLRVMESQLFVSSRYCRSFCSLFANTLSPIRPKS